MSPAIPLCDSCPAAFEQSPLLTDDPTLPDRLVLMLRTNSNPGHEDQSFVTLRHIVDSSPPQLERYDAEIARLESLRQQIMTNRDALQRLYMHAKNILDTPVRRLPDELLVDILQRCRLGADTPFNKASEMRRLAGGPLVMLSQVCAHWRNVIHGTPAFWSTFEVDMSNITVPGRIPSASLQQRVLDLVTTALERSQQIPIAVKVRGHPQRPTGLEREVIQAVVERSQRWRTALFELRLDYDMQESLHRANANIPLLEVLCIRALNKTDRRRVPSYAIQYFTSADSLREVHVSGMEVEPLMLWRHSQFINCSYERVECEDLKPLIHRIQILPNGGCLHMQFDFKEIAAAEEQPKLPSVVSHIGELTLSSSNHEHDKKAERVLANILGALTLPELHNLNFRGMPPKKKSQAEDFEPLYWPHAAALEFFTRCESGLNLSHLSLADIFLTKEELLELLASLPALTSLFISDHPAKKRLITDPVLEALSVPGTGQAFGTAHRLLPNLTRLDIRSRGKFTEDSLLQLLRSRAGGSGTVTGRNPKFECVLMWFPRERYETNTSAEYKFREVMKFESIEKLVKALKGRLGFIRRLYKREDYVNDVWA
ncbi:hypothetical protein FB45DRAFT_895236 [Roridomyces roridus]|uniref:F-box domain-containing protein n=1 Tax=Roridomyces roridus TaxID=1738132 RepID=A0AAD7G180_9AGAR|nr:hypothetical protein FB45DRAFT_895236 [Roridomyces roridus]